MMKRYIFITILFLGILWCREAKARQSHHKSKDRGNSETVVPVGKTMVRLGKSSANHKYLSVRNDSTVKEPDKSKKYHQNRKTEKNLKKASDVQDTIKAAIGNVNISRVPIGYG